jgi:hypothetical protein
MAVVPSSLHKPFDLTLGQILTLAVMGVGQATSANCSLYRGWWLGLMGRVHWDNYPVLMLLVLIAYILRTVLAHPGR